MKPVVFLDIDGVINIFPGRGKSVKNGKHLRHWENWEQEVFADPDTPGVGMRFTWSPEMLEELLALKEVVDFVFLSTWVHHTQGLLPSIIGTSAISNRYLAKGEGRADYGSLSFDEPWWKVVALEKEISANPRPFIWIDDMYSRKLRYSVQDIAKWNNVPGDLVRSYEQYGITREILETVKSFLVPQNEGLVR